MGHCVFKKWIHNQFTSGPSKNMYISVANITAVAMIKTLESQFYKSDSNLNLTACIPMNLCEKLHNNNVFTDQS